jgi:hypothetical protein
MRTARGGIRRSAIAAIGIVALLLMSLGVAWAAKTPRTRVVNVAKTYEVLVPAGAGVPGGGIPADDGSNWPSVEWQVGEVTVEARFISVHNEGAPGYSWGQFAPIVTNHGTGRVAVIIDNALIDQDGFTWIDPGEQGVGGALGYAGELYNSGGDPPYDGLADWPTDEPSGAMMSIAILDEGGVTATGFFAFSYRYTAADQMGHLVYTLQLKGNGS